MSPLGARADLDACREKLMTGDYEGCIEEAAKAIEEGEFAEEWRLLKARGQLITGQYGLAKATVEEALRRYTSSIRLRLLAHDVYQQSGEWALARQMLLQINQLVSNRSWWYTSVEELVVQGEAALLLGADPKQVLQLIYDEARTKHPDRPEPYLAIGRLALQKHDYAEAGNAYQAGVRVAPNHADMHFGVAMAFAPSDGEKAALALERCLRINPRHVPALLEKVDHLIDGEYYRDAEQMLTKVFDVNPAHPEGWAYTAVLAHLENDAEGEKAARLQALKHWPNNPRVDHLIGKKLSQKYRFAEGAAHQRKALEFDKDYLPAKMQLATDLLRLGEVEEGWKLAQEVLEDDAYNVVAFNLVTLQENIARFTVLESEHFTVRMASREAAIYGDAVLELLERAYHVLGEKYGLKPPAKTIVEIFPDQKDFAIRTFGLPGGAGYLGVCFGRVITANSPAAQGPSPSNWQAVLWHEYCHVVTLQATRNRMPRWLSEGISVYEERRQNAAWGQRMNLTYKQMIDEGELTPVGRLSAAFLRAPSALHIQFAYYESSLVVEYIVETAGPEALKKVLAELHDGVYINDALSLHVAPIKELEEDFESYAKAKAAALAPEADFEPLPRDAGRDLAAVKAVLEETPNNLPALAQLARLQIAAEAWADAKETLRRMIELYPDDTGGATGGSGYLLLAHVHRELDETDQEYELLEKFASLDADAGPVYERLIQIAGLREDWPAVLRHAQRLLAVNPLLPEPYRWLAKAAQYTGDKKLAIRAWRNLLLMDPADPALVHYQLASLLYETGDTGGDTGGETGGETGGATRDEAKRHVLQAIEEAPRYRDAHRLLLKMREPESPDAAPPAPPAPPASAEDGLVPGAASP